MSEKNDPGWRSFYESGFTQINRLERFAGNKILPAQSQLSEDRRRGPNIDGARKPSRNIRAGDRFTGLLPRRHLGRRNQPQWLERLGDPVIDFKISQIIFVSLRCDHQFETTAL